MLALIYVHFLWKQQPRNELMQETLEIICIALQGYALVFQKREEYIFGVLYEHLSNINYLTYLQKHCAINTKKFLF